MHYENIGYVDLGMFNSKNDEKFVRATILFVIKLI